MDPGASAFRGYPPFANIQIFRLGNQKGTAGNHKGISRNLAGVCLCINVWF